MTENIISLTEFKTNAAKLIDKLKHRPHSLILTQNGRATAVIQDMDSYQRQLDAIAMLKLVTTGEADIKKGKLTPQNQVFNSLKNQLKE